MGGLVGKKKVFSFAKVHLKKRFIFSLILIFSLKSGQLSDVISLGTKIAFPIYIGRNLQNNAVSARYYLLEVKQTTSSRYHIMREFGITLLITLSEKEKVIIRNFVSL